MHPILLVILALPIAILAQAPTATPEANPAQIIRPIDTAFDVQPDSIPGGCSAAQKDDLSAAFDEMIVMKNIISIATGVMSDDLEMPSVGWMFNYLFAIPSTQENQEFGEFRDSAQVDNLMSIWSLMELIDGHSSGRFRVRNARGEEGKTRLYCSNYWIISTDDAIDPRTDKPIEPRRPMKGGGESLLKTPSLQPRLC
ncbi:hypothetical protein IFR05_011676 [Cadophora sp. M221]|nr:hypothetical protein IFR05_011676 [Cadophora sp. M221]